MITVSKLYKSFPLGSQTLEVLKNINVTISEGQFSIIYGPSGCGKTTLLNSILGLETPTSGSVTFNGQSIYSVSEDERSIIRKKNFGFIYQQATWINSLDVLNNVAFPLILDGIKTETALIAAKEELKKVGMTKWETHTLTELSAGQKQKVALARALITKPEILIADEPTGNLDFTSGNNLIATLKELNENENLTIVMVTHDLNYISTATNIIQIFDGEIITQTDVNNENIKELTEKLKEVPTVKAKSETKTKIIIEKAKTKNSAVVTFRDVSKSFLSILHTSLIITLYYLHLLFIKIRLNFINKLLITPLLEKIDPFKGEISKRQLIALSIQNMQHKKTRSNISTLGIAFGISIIILLLSFGYGLEKIVIEKVSTLQSRSQLEINPTVNSNIELNDETLLQFMEYPEVEAIYPLVNAAGKVSHNESVLDVVIYGVQGDYLKYSDIKLSEGETFTTNSVGIKNEIKIDEENQLINLDLNTNKRVALANKTFFEGLDLASSSSLQVDLSIFLSISLTDTEKSQTEPITYEIVGIIADESTPMLYIPLDDLLYSGIKRYSEAKVIINKEENIDTAAYKFETEGFTVSSIHQTIDNIKITFSYLRVALLSIGTVALLIAALGVFNTLTISLLERTREVGYMKIIGMNRLQIYNLFITESLTMIFSGALLGLFLGVLSGAVLSFFISLYSIANSGEWIYVTRLPLIISVLILLSAAILGLLTGLYPARRASRMSALNAIRYEI
jgi:ABC-type lipoprotein export system ATPase subunit/ABC-type lipoprotein release transport system permease subunit